MICFPKTHNLRKKLTTCWAPSATRGLDVVEGEPASPYSALERRLAQDSEEVELDLTPGAPDSASDPVRVYLREMGASPLLTREEEVEIAKRIERGQVTSMKALSRSPIVIQQVLALGEDLKRGLRSIKDLVAFDEEEITDEILRKRVDDITGRIDDLNKHYKTANRLAEKLATIPAKKKPKEYRRCRGQLGREMVRISLIDPQSRTDPRRAQAPDRTGKQDHRRHACARSRSREPGSEDSRARAARNSRRIIAPRSGRIASR